LYGKENVVTIAIPEELPSVPDELSQASAAAAYSSVPAPPSYAAPTSTGFTLSTVDLSQDTQAHILQDQGESPSEIAQSLNITIAVVDGYLGIPVPPAATLTPAETTAASEGAPTQSTTAPSDI
jgi:hypothetical protein